MTNEYADRVPMSLKDMQAYLQSYFGIPIALRRQGDTMINCPYCGKTHDHEPEPGHHVAQCAEDDRGGGIVVGERSFVPNYGYTIVEYVAKDGANQIIPPVIGTEENSEYP
ncbi:hypothetical protein SEMRO_619_G176410.1 [Seminavis robusta]|uniref:Uncharacterized protein n=1 Tax=Seminavis robusta TaxID=568900 RepID=A0A9N8E892_9STRA|nr:hypothetical protein SEMRO_619_G176410.1 [Seminavis robusta]|eukprot:Sro619_g176410.1 n/a (111) ;mRNA; r:21204-21536